MDETAISALPSGLAGLVRQLQQHDVEDLNNIVLVGKLKERTDEVFEMLDANYDLLLHKSLSAATQSSNAEENPDSIYCGFIFSHVPMLKGGKDYFRKNNRYKDWDSKNPKEVMVKYVVEKDGTASNVVVIESSGIDDLDKEAVRLIKEAEYTVGILRKNGKEVRTGNMMSVVPFPPK